MRPGHIGLPLRRIGAGLALGLILAAALAAPAPAADDVGEMRNTCAVSGGTAGGDANSFSCCWPGWGCVYCAVSEGTISADQCWTDCDSEACRDANARDRLGLPPAKKPPAATAPGTTPGTLAPPQTKKPLQPALPGADTIQ